MIPTDTIDKLTATWSSISALGSGLTEEQWKSPTELPGWTVQDLISHLIGTERFLEGLPRTEHRSEPRDYVKNPIGELNEHEVDSRRTSSGAQVLAEFDALVARREQTLRNADDAYFAQPAATPTGPGTMADFLHIRVLDNWLHEQDMRRALGLPGTVEGAAAEHTIDRLIRTVPIVVGKRAATPEGGAVVIDITGGVHRHIVTEVHDGRAAVVAAPTAEPLATITIDAATFVALSTGRITAADVPDAFDITGDTDLGQRVVSQLNMMI